jgi:hypothetical protein
MAAAFVTALQGSIRDGGTPPARPIDLSTTWRYRPLIAGRDWGMPAAKPPLNIAHRDS